MDLDKLKDGYNNVVNSIYSCKNYYERVKTFLENYSPKIHKYKKLKPREVSAFFLACFRLGVASKGRREYWKLLGWAFSKGRKVFVMAVTFSIYGYHFRKCLTKTESAG